MKIHRLTLRRDDLLIFGNPAAQAPGFCLGPLRGLIQINLSGGYAPIFYFRGILPLRSTPVRCLGARGGTAMRAQLDPGGA
jgi:hypothetical protein